MTSGDTESYLVPGRNLLLHGCFVTGALPEIDRTPGYPLFLALASLAGPASAAVLQVLLSCSRWSLSGGWRALPSTMNPQRFWQDGPLPLNRFPSFIRFVCCPRHCFSRSLFCPWNGWWHFSIAGAWVCWPWREYGWLQATFVRPVAFYLPIALALGLMAVFIRVPGLRWKAPLVLLASTVPLLGAWQAKTGRRRDSADFRAS